MANLPKWTIPFMSLGGYSCRADIYDMDATEDYTGDPTELVAAANPIQIDEDNDDDLLTVIRARTGYLNIYETDDTSAAIEALKPATNTSRKVLIYRGTEVIFSGFMQAQTFQNAWVPNPRQLSFPIMSPLALVDDVDMPTYNPPSRQMLCKLLADAIGQLNDKGAGIESVVWPKEYKLLSELVSTLPVCPWNDAHDTTTASTEPLLKPNPTRYLIEAVCNCFGWQVHDEPGRLVFTKFDHDTENDADYLEATPANLATYSSISTATYTGTTTLALTDYMQVADAAGEESILMPYEKVRLNYDGDVVKSAEFDFSHLTYNGEAEANNQYVAFFVSDTPELEGYSPDGHLLRTNTFGVNNALVTEGVMAAVYGGQSQQTAGFLYRHSYPGDTTILYDAHLFDVTFFDRPTSSEFRIKYDLVWGSMIGEFGNDTSREPSRVGIRVRVGNLYYQDNGQWSTTRPTYSVYNFGLMTNVPAGPLTVEFYDASNTGVPSGTEWWMYSAIENLHLETVDAVFSEYKIVNKGYTDLKLSDGCGQQTADIYAGYNAYYRNSNLLGDSLITNPALWFTRYDYMLYSREQLTLRMRRNSAALPYYMKCARVSFAGQSWRLISLAHDPWNDECTVQLQRSLQPQENE